jgi:HK97 family phage prohead protease
MSTKIEVRSVASELRAADDRSFQIRGTAAAYNRLSKDLGGFRERIAPGAFKRALSGQGEDVKCLFNHDANCVLGRTGNGTLRLSDSAEGLNFRCQLDQNQQAHRDLYSSIKRGDINECSFAFNVDDEDGEDWDDEKDERGQRFKLRTLRSVNLFDVSAVTNPAYGSGATKVSARSTDYVISKRGDVWAAERAQLQKLDDDLADDLNRIRLARIGEELGRGK